MSIDHPGTARMLPRTQLAVARLGSPARLSHIAATFLSLALSLTPAASRAQWATNGSAVCTATGNQQAVDATSDGLGGAVMVWEDNRSGGSNIYAREIDAFGVDQWAPNGVVLSNGGSEFLPRAAHDDFGYIYYAWLERGTTTSKVLAAVSDRFGNILTPSNGLALKVGATTTSLPAPSLTTNRSLGVAFAAWTDDRNGNFDVYAQAFNFGVFWPANGLAICTLPSSQSAPAVCDAGPVSDGAIVAWNDQRNGNADIFAQRADLSGNLTWGANGVPVCDHASSQGGPMIVSDGAGGAIVAWQDSRGGGLGAIYAQRINFAGTRLWAIDGIPVAVSAGQIFFPKMIADGFGGAILTWRDERDYFTTGPDIYAQGIDGNGNVLWGTNGVAVCTAQLIQDHPSIASDGQGGAMITWQDYRVFNQPADIYVERIGAGGLLPIGWPVNGVLVCSAVKDQEVPQAVTADAFGAIVAWVDDRNDDGDIFAQRIESLNATIGHPRPTILSAADVPADHGGFVRLQWRPGDGPPVVSYDIWRVTDDEIVGSGPGNGSPTYTIDVPTTGDGTPNEFFVAIHDGMHSYLSPYATATSLDNLLAVDGTAGPPAALTVVPYGPNPARGATTMRLGLPAAGPVELEIFDASGARVAQRRIDAAAAGWRLLTFDGRDDLGHMLPSGVFFFRVQAAGEMRAGRTVIAR